MAIDIYDDNDPDRPRPPIPPPAPPAVPPAVPPAAPPGPPGTFRNEQTGQEYTKKSPFFWDDSDYGAPMPMYPDSYTAGIYNPARFQERFAAPTAEDRSRGICINEGVPGFIPSIDTAARGDY